MRTRSNKGKWGRNLTGLSHETPQSFARHVCSRPRITRWLREQPDAGHPRAQRAGRQLLQVQHLRLSGADRHRSWRLLDADHELLQERGARADGAAWLSLRGRESRSAGELLREGARTNRDALGPVVLGGLWLLRLPLWLV